MKELIEKIVDRLEKEGNEIYREQIEHPLKPMVPTGKKDILVSHAIRIIQEEAKSYNESVKTNADYIRNMTDEELAESRIDRIDMYTNGEFEEYIGNFSGIEFSKEDAIKAEMDWLKAEREG